MTIELSDQLQIIAPDRTPNARGRFAFTLISDKKGRARLSIGRKAYAAIGAPPAVAVALSTQKIAIMPAQATDSRARKVYSNLEVNLANLGAVLGIKPGERFVCDVTVHDGSLVADWPVALFTRRAYAARKAENVTPITGRERVS